MQSIQNKTPTEIEDKKQNYFEYQKQYRATHNTQKQEYMKSNKEKLAEFQRKYDRERRANKDEKYIRSSDTAPSRPRRRTGAAPALRALWRSSFVRDMRPVTIPWYGRVSEGCFDFEE